MTGQSWWDSVALEPITLVYALAVSGVLITLGRFRELIGGEVFRNLMLGRYHRPVEEERIFLFLDLIGSTAYAQTHGDLKAQAFLGAIFATLAAPVRRSRGAIDDYVGDMALITWPMATGTAQARCVACIFDFPRCRRARRAALASGLRAGSLGFAPRCMAGASSRPRSGSTGGRSPISAMW